MAKYIAVDQYGTHIPIQEHPRKELMEYFGTSHAQKMYTDLKSGGYRHIGYVVRGHWCRVLGLEGVKFAKDFGK